MRTRITDDYYLPGQLMYPQVANVTGGDFTTVPTGSLVDVTGLSINYTPPVNCWVLVICQLRVSNTIDGVRCVSAIDVNGSGVNVSSIVLGTKTLSETVTAFYWGPLTRDTAYTIKGQCWQAAGGGTLTVASDTGQSQLVVIPFCKP